MSLCTFLLIKFLKKRIARRRAEEAGIDGVATPLATRIFSDENKLGEGGYGPVYKGKLHDGQEIAVKRLSLDAFLFDASKSRLLDWTKHFGMARILPDDQILARTDRVVGTIGYMSPEYAMEGQISEKSDVFSFGVLLLEVVSGKRNNYFLDEDLALNLLGYAWTLWKDNRVVEVIDPSLGDSWNQEEVMRCIKLGLLCVQELPVDRPTMSTVVAVLNGDINLPEPKQVAFFAGRSPATSISSMDGSKRICLWGDISIVESPEYATEGQISVKSDVYSYVVLQLEIVSGFRNSSFPLITDTANLLAYPWKLWDEGNAPELIVDSRSPDEALRSVRLVCRTARTIAPPFLRLSSCCRRSHHLSRTQAAKLHHPKKPKS
ncbi:hypothetical protein OPV22_015085 [Ensete ventricosum]|uniref:Protein kinase domain-containing protein n=1 Tax=Ensete ventricosum TaxID=4639 RepID=A0AAV8R4Q2_ENSVE|nr:hypothetical protein OPV22_015085 [Ensete ventricosum]